MPRHARAIPLLLLLAIAAIAGHRPAAAADFFVLAVSWQPAFCETRPAKPECVTQDEDRFDASHFALHGLWPQPRGNVYCGVEPGLRASASSDERPEGEEGASKCRPGCSAVPE